MSDIRVRDGYLTELAGIPHTQNEYVWTFVQLARTCTECTISYNINPPSFTNRKQALEIQSAHSVFGVLYCVAFPVSNTTTKQTKI